MDWILYVGIIQALFVSVYMMSKSRRVSTDYILSIWMIFLAFPMITRLIHIRYPHLMVPYLSDIKSFPLTFGPFLLLYIKSLTEIEYRMHSKELLHFVPFCLFAAVQMLFPDQFVFPEQRTNGPPSMISVIHGIFNIVSLIAYSLFVLMRLNRHRLHITDYFSSITGRINLKWLYWVIIGFIIAFSLPILFKPAMELFNRSFEGSGQATHGQAFTFFILVLGFFGLKQSPVYLEPDEQGEQKEEKKQKEEPEENNRLQTIPTANEKKPPKYERSGLKEIDAQNYLDRLEDYMQQSKPYLDANLNIELPAKKVRIPKHYITQILNEKLAKNFHQFINAYRIKEAIRQLRNPENSQVTILDISYNSGFNSKSTFNTFFKKQTKMTPSEFRKKHLLQEVDRSG